MPAPNVIKAVVAWMYYGVEHHHQYHYTQDMSGGPQDRWGWKKRKPGTLPWYGDCSSHIAYVLWAAGGKCPSGNGFSFGNTDTLAAHCKEITEAQLRAGDLVIYWDGATTTGPSGHVGMFIKKGPHGLLTNSMGEEGDPNWCYVGPLGDTRPHKFFRFDAGLRAGVKAPVFPPTAASPKKPSTTGTTSHVPTNQPAPKPTPAPSSVAAHAPQTNGATTGTTGHVAATQVVFQPFGYGANDHTAGGRVSLLQKRLGLKPTGNYGRLTLMAVKKFKKANGLPTDGVIGAASWAKLGLA